jgi:hypothetical protein
VRFLRPGVDPPVTVTACVERGEMPVDGEGDQIAVFSQGVNRKRRHEASIRAVYFLRSISASSPKMTARAAPVLLQVDQDR